MERLTNTLTEVDERTLLQENFWDRFIITEEKIPEKYRDLQAQILIERGEGRSLSDGKLTPVQKKPLADMVIADQKSSLAQWTKYLSSTDADYSPEMKYWIMRSVTNLQAYNKEQGNFPKRKKDTVAIFPELNQEALALVVNHKMQEIQGMPSQKLTREMTDEEWKVYQQKQSF